MSDQKITEAADIGGGFIKIIGVVLICAALSDLVPLKDGLMIMLGYGMIDFVNFRRGHGK